VQHEVNLTVLNKLVSCRLLSLYLPVIIDERVRLHYIKELEFLLVSFLLLGKGSCSLRETSSWCPTSNC
jgi:hypothetical protein